MILWPKISNGVGKYINSIIWMQLCNMFLLMALFFNHYMQYPWNRVQNCAFILTVCQREQPCSVDCDSVLIYSWSHCLFKSRRISMILLVILKNIVKSNKTLKKRIKENVTNFVKPALYRKVQWRSTVFGSASEVLINGCAKSAVFSTWHPVHIVSSVDM